MLIFQKQKETSNTLSRILLKKKLYLSRRKKYIFDSINIVQTYVHHSFLFFLYPVLSSPVALILKCDILEMCVCARLPVRLTVYVSVRVC